LHFAPTLFFHSLPASKLALSANMASQNFAGGRGGIPTSNQRGFDSTSAHLSLQPAINEPFGGLYSPLEHGDFSQSFAASPPQLPPIQPGGRHRYFNNFSNPANLLSTNSAAVPPNYGTPVSSTIDSFERGMSFGTTTIHGYSSSVGGGTELPG
jgi:hypothetical protein